MRNKLMSAVCKAVAVTALGLGATACTHDSQIMLPPETQTNIDRADPQMRTVLDAYLALSPKPIEELSPAQARQQPTIADAAKKVMADQKIAYPEPVGAIDNRSIPGPSGPLNVRVYYPQGDGPFPGLVYFHGGGWVLGNLDTNDASCRALCNDAHCVVVSVDYRLAPEHKYPSAPEDAYTATQYVISHPAEFKIDGHHVAVGGESAGGNLAVAVCLMSRDRGVAMPIYQLVIYPVTNYAFDTESYRSYSDAFPLGKPAMTWFFGNYLETSSGGSDPDVSVLRADLSKLPPATVITAQIDPLRTEGEALKTKLASASPAGAVQYMNYDGVTHDFFGLGKIVDQARQAERFAAQGLNSAFAK